METFYLVFVGRVRHILRKWNSINCVVLSGQFDYSVMETKRVCLLSLFRQKKISQWGSFSAYYHLNKTTDCSFKASRTASCSSYLSIIELCICLCPQLFALTVTETQVNTCVSCSVISDTESCDQRSAVRSGLLTSCSYKASQLSLLM